MKFLVCGQRKKDSQLSSHCSFAVAISSCESLFILGSGIARQSPRRRKHIWRHRWIFRVLLQLAMWTRTTMHYNFIKMYNYVEILSQLISSSIIPYCTIYFNFYVFQFLWKIFIFVFLIKNKLNHLCYNILEYLELIIKSWELYFIKYVVIKCQENIYNLN